MPDGLVLDPMASMLPQLKGYGKLPDLSYSLTLNVELKQEVIGLVTSAHADNFELFRGKFHEMLFTWAGVGGIDENEYGSYADSNKVAFLERFFGASVYEWSGVSDINGRFAEQLNLEFSRIADALLLRFFGSS